MNSRNDFPPNQDEPEPGNLPRESHDADFTDPCEEIAAYVAGELTPAAAADFEQRLAGDEFLRREVEATRAALDDARAWLGETPPGIERAETLKAPFLSSPKGIPSSSRPRPRFQKYLAVAAIFLLGFLLGRVSDWIRSGGGTSITEERATADAPEGRPGGAVKSDQPDQTDGIEKTRGTGAPSNPPVPSPQTTPSTPPPHPASSQGFALAQAAAPPPRRTYSDNGKLIIETTLKESGAQALWVVDAGFRLDTNHDRQ